MNKNNYHGRKKKITEVRRHIYKILGKKYFPIVGIGASAGGVKAFKELLENLSDDTGMAFVLVQHLEVKRVSLLAKVLSRSTKMPVLQVEAGMKMEPDHVYVIPPGKSVAIAKGKFKLIPRIKTRGKHHSIDYFLSWLAKERKSRAIGVILSGAGADGTAGLQAIKNAGGLTFAQDKSAEFRGMPKSARTEGVVDFVLSPKEIARKLKRIARSME